MGYHPETLAFAFPPYARKGFGKWLYGLSPWLGVDVWHLDPERRGTGNRTDDSCGWFDRTPGQYAEAVAYVFADENTMEEIARSIATRRNVTHGGKYTYPRMSLSETLAVTLMVARELETRRWWNGKRPAHSIWWRKVFTRARMVDGIAYTLALNPLDNLSSVEEPESFVGLVAAAMNRKFRPWWRHPRWHVHHWQVNFHLARNVKRMFQPCATCHRPLGFGVSPYQDGLGLHHCACVGISGPCAAETAKTVSA